MKRLILVILAIVLVSAVGTAGFAVYRLSHPGWIVTQYPDDSGNNALCYSLFNDADGTLILVDGGWIANADRVRGIIEEYGGKVDYWFLTHYHGDHCGAFDTLYEEYKDRIGTIYVTPLVWEDFEKTCRDWDTPEIFRQFLDMTAGDERVHPLHREDEFDIGTLHIKVFNAYDEEVTPRTTDLANNCTLVFKMTGQEDTMLFLGDLSDRNMGAYVLDRYGEELHADYVQAAHHGNWGQDISFYEALHPSVILFDSPEFIMTGEKYTAKELKAWCDENGIMTYDYRTAPNSFTIR